ncbi:hypothetical protein FRD01_22200 [Microvenator marinus]|uniref:Outer membrane protein beta-barrel domain-containing protein n=1 Tax=Microvenator marinus TaxID=2600177 RepID=A0A5B8Y1S4_9DELT|nr:hypothetical protein [Microvenator marinus]QED29896.1 hypothetical protein FRD01_22200 [Microvenator marinus]
MKSFLIALAITLSACAQSTYHTATPIASGTNELGVSAGLGYASGDYSFLGSDDSEPDSKQLRPTLDLSYRRGLNTWSDLGVHVGTSLLRVDYNAALVNSPSFALSLNPQLDTHLRLTMGIYADVLKSSGAIVTLNLSPSYIFLEESPAAGAGILLKIPIGAFSAILYFQTEKVLKVARSLRPALSLTGGLGLAYGF